MIKELNYTMSATESHSIEDLKQKRSDADGQISLLIQ